MIPDQVAHYQILKKIGEGGMGEVYQAKDTRLGRTVALKILPESFASDKYRLHRFLREARVASTLSHPNVTHIYEIGEENGTHFIAMEFVDGETLHDRLRHGPLDNEQILMITSQISEVLDKAQQLGIVHRDLKPSNIMIDSRNQAKILDFGLARQDRVADEDVNRLSTEAHTESGAILGTAPYMSPEQALGKKVDYRSDIFSIGVVMYEMATAQRPFSGPTVMAVIDQILHAQPVSATRINPKLHSDFKQIIEKCMRKEQSERYQSWKDLLADLRSIRTQLSGNTIAPGVVEGEYNLSRGTARTCFALIQIMYLAFYVSALRWSDGMEAGFAELLGAGVAPALTLTFIITALAGIAIRLHLIFLVLWDHVSTGVQFRKIFPVVFAFDIFWTFAPFALIREVHGIVVMSPALLLACVPPLAFTPFAQRTLIRSAYDLHYSRRISTDR